jgi:HD-GYP domain-containing protein (c-di-GMP phosphodiesterase class II)
MGITFAEHDRVAGEVFLRLAAEADEFEGYRRPHAARVASIADALAARFRLAREDRSALVFAALLHDVGEMAMRRDYIRRPGPLTEDERLDLWRHPVIGEQEAAKAGADRAVQLLVRWHHEWWNGGGYPDALRGERIPLAARILRAADAYAALTDERPFRPAETETAARRHLTELAGIEFDPRVVLALLALEGLPALRAGGARRSGRLREEEGRASAAEPGAASRAGERTLPAGAPVAPDAAPEVVHAMDSAARP